MGICIGTTQFQGDAVVHGHLVPIMLEYILPTVPVPPDPSDLLLWFWALYPGGPGVAEHQLFATFVTVALGSLESDRH